VPSLLVGYKEEWLVIPPSGMKFWEKAQLEAYAPKKNISYYAICPSHELLAIQVPDYLKELSCIYEVIFMLFFRLPILAKIPFVFSIYRVAV